ncbi:NAD(P)/FAD-dependent oxidoreductase [Sanguibacter suaedae]|uniref:NAD(P)/FAD-dependent oxidoreductase n=1 Tax=Sanguibacter suaedae TaxID=2795737 RepID=A0A934M6M4_9MICO|nr:NAD(P)/FAD-dependent oxidoreductase [Sanguibacter suaedae]MBI9114417.1 NAD(P)/FAD-dependent oxidoreductase [Sanguibacter suaedae]
MTSPAPAPPTVTTLPYDALVVGGGVAGLSAALVLGSARRRVLVADGGAPRNAPAAHSHGFLTRDGVEPGELVRLAREEVEGYGVEVVPLAVEDLDRWGEGFRATLGDGSSVTARTVLLATGLVDELPDVPGVRERWGRDVPHCPFCHGHDVEGTPIATLASTEASFHQALLLRQWSDDVVLFTHTAPSPPPDVARQLAARDVRVVEGPVECLVVEDDRLVGVLMSDGRTVPRSAVFVTPTFRARDGLVTPLGARTTHDECARWVEVDDHQRTSVPGLWAAGNVTDPGAQAITAAAEGSRAGVSMNVFLVDDDVERAVQRRVHTSGG